MVILNHRMSNALGTLSNQIVIKESALLGLDDDFDMDSFKAWIDVRGHTVGEGPIYVGVCDNDYTTSEIQEYFTVSGPRSFSDKVELEKSQRSIVVVGMIDTGKTSGPLLTKTDSLGYVSQKFEMAVSDISGMAWFAFNDDDAALTTGTVISGFCRYKGAWL